MSRAEFTNATKLAVWLRAHGYCEKCGCLFGGKKGHYDHIIPAAMVCDNTPSNCQLLCVECHRRKTGKEDMPTIAKSNRIRKRHAGIRKPRTILTGRKLDGTPVRYPKER